MNRRLRWILLFLLIIIFIVSAVKIIQQMNDYSKGADTYLEAVNVAGLQQTDETEPTENIPEAVKALAETDLTALQAINSDVIGWISIPGTTLSYPLLQGEDNDYYLSHTWKKEHNSVGSIFIDPLISANFTDFNTLVYGHRMRNGSMFGSLPQYKDIEYWKAHPSIYILNADGVYQYDIFAAYEAKLNEITYGLQISDLDTKLKFIQHGIDSSVIDTGITPAQQDRILTLVTCTGKDYSGRWVVQAVLKGSI